MKRVLAGLVLLLASVIARADVAADVVSLQKEWDHLKYEVTDAAARSAGFSALADKAAAVVKQHPKNADALVWQGIILSTYAGEKGGLGALSLVKQAKAVLEQALALDERAMNGGAHTSLGSLYYQVPVWPIGFGNDELARTHLMKGLAIAPDDIDANYFYADFLYTQGENDTAVQLLEKAAKAPARPGREVGDKGRRDEIAALIRKIGNN